MEYYFDTRFLNHNETVFYIYLVVIVLMIIFGAVKTYKEIKNDNK